MRCVLLAGGKGVRLRPLTYSVPKPLLPVGERPILEEIIDRLKAFAIEEFIIAVGYRGELIETYFRDGSQLGVRIDYVHETHPLGTAGPLSLVRAVRDFEPDETVLVMNGDILTDIDVNALVSFHERSANELTVATREFELQHPYGVIQLDGDRVTGIVEKPIVRDTVSAGVYAVRAAVLARVPDDRFFDVPDLVNGLLADGFPVGAFRFEGQWLAIDRPEQLEDAARLVAERDT